jgi:hypothetical protein
MTSGDVPELVTVNTRRDGLMPSFTVPNEKLVELSVIAGAGT